MSDRVLRGLYTLAYEGTDELQVVRGARVTSDKGMAQLDADHENQVNLDALKVGGPTRPRIVVAELLVSCRVVQG